MTDEEMAEEYVENIPFSFETEVTQRIVKIYAMETFLAGLKAGRPEWHDLRKDPNDLPENKRNVWCDYGDGYGKGYYNKDDGGWWIEGHLYCSTLIAWCELLQFTE